MEKMLKRSSKIPSQTKRNVFWLLVYFLFNLAGIVLGVLCLYKSRTLFIANHRFLFSILTGIAFTAGYVACVFVVLYAKEVWKKTLFSLYILITFTLTLLLVLQATGFFMLIKDQTSLQEYIKGAGRWMPFAYIALQYLQVVLLPIPAIVSTLAGVALFGAFSTIIYSLIGIVTASITAFLIGRKLGYKAVAWLVGKESLDKWQKKLKGKDNFFLTLAFLLPVFPDDILCFVAGLSSMSLRYFSIMILICRGIGITATCFSFDFIPFTTWWGLLIWGALLALIAGLFVWIYKNFDALQAWFSKRFKIANKNKDYHSKNK